MIDFVKIRLDELDSEEILTSEKLDFKTEVSEKTGELSNCKTAKYHYCKVEVFDSGRILFSGSIHKLWNSLNKVYAPNYNPDKYYKGYNGNQFSLDNIIEMRNHLAELFNCNYNQMAFENVEFGLNTNTDFEPKKFLKGLLFHRATPFEFQFKGNYSQVNHQRYIIKIYNKSWQYGMDKHTLRVELKFVKMDTIHFIKTFADINKATLNRSFDILINKFNEVVYYDYTIVKKGLKSNQITSLKDYSNPRYWINDVTNDNRYYHKGNLKEIIKKHSSNLHKQVNEELYKKFRLNTRQFEEVKTDLIKIETKEKNTSANTILKESKFRLNTHSYTVVINSNRILRDYRQYPFKLRDKNTLCFNTRLEVKKYSDYLHKKEVNYTQSNTHKCKVTNLDISMQKQESQFLFTTGLKYYYETNTTLFQELKETYLSDKWKTSPFEKQLKEIAHNIRNNYNNSKYKQEKIYTVGQNNLLGQLYN